MQVKSTDISYLCKCNCNLLYNVVCKDTSWFYIDIIYYYNYMLSIHLPWVHTNYMLLSFRIWYANLAQEIWWVTAASICDQEGANSRIRLEFGEVRGSQENKTNWEENPANPKRNIKKFEMFEHLLPKSFFTLTSEMLFSPCVKVFFPDQLHGFWMIATLSLVT